MKPKRTDKSEIKSDELHPVKQGACKSDQSKTFKGRKDRRDYRGSRPTDGSVRLSKTNDPTWYMKNPIQAQASANLSFASMLGLKFNIPGHSPDAISAHAVDEPVMPGICTLWLDSGVGTANVATDPVTVAATNIYTFNRQKNSGAKNYEVPDYFMYLIAMRDAYAAFGYLMRIYGLINKYKVTNRYTPKGLFQALHLNYDNFKGNMAQFLFRINVIGAKIDSLCAPAALEIYRRAFWQFTAVYEEDETGKGQMYMYAPRSLLKFSATVENTGSSLVPIWFERPNTTSDWQWDTLCDAVESLIDPLVTDEDIGIMSGDTRKWTEGNDFHVGQVPADFTIDAILDKNVLQQMHNAITSDPWDSGPYPYTTPNDQLTSWVYQQNLAILTRTLREGLVDDGVTNMGAQFDSILDVDAENPSVEEVLEFTRLKCVVDINDDYVISALYCDVYTLHHFSIVYREAADDNLCTLYTMDTRSKSGVIPPITGMARSQYLITQFEWAPIIYLTTGYYSGGGSTQGAQYIAHFIGNFHNYAVVDKQTLRNLHTTALLSQYSIPASEHLK